MPECPFGDDFQPPAKVEFRAVFSSEALQSHVAGHMKEVALLTLQKLPSDNDENAENVDSDQLLEDDGPAGALGIPRASMYSVLDDGDLEFQDDDAEAAESNVGHREEDISARVTVLDVEDKDDLGMTKLHHAVQAGDRETSEQKKRETILALMSMNEGSKVHLDAFHVNKPPLTGSFFNINLKGNM